MADGAERGIVVRDGRIVELVGRGRDAASAVDAAFDASRHVVLPGLVNAHHHFYQTLTRALPPAIDARCFPGSGALSDLGAADAGPSAGSRRGSRWPS